MNHRQGAPPQPRRTFRGSGGPTDGRLPPKKKKTAAVRHDGTKYDSPLPSPIVQVQANLENAAAQTNDYVEAANSTGPLEPPEPGNHRSQQNGVEVLGFEAEVKHLQKRIANHRLSMSQSSNCSLKNYASNVLNAAVKIIREWDSIYRYHLVETETSISLDEAVVDQIGTLVFELIQQCIQCGPLAGAKPGYFKRCGSDVAGTVAAFLGIVVQDNTISGLSEAQCTAIQKWKANAEKASVVPKPPSKSMQKKLNKKK